MNRRGNRGNAGLSLEQRFWQKVIQKDGCWEWDGAHNGKGYSQFWNGHKLVYAHRFMWEWHYGPLHRRTEVDHTCFNHGCVNLAHLRPATKKQNMENPAEEVPRNNVSGVRGVWWDKEKQRWQARVNHHGRAIYVGRFVSLEDAAAAVRAKRLELYTHNLLDREGETVCL